MAGDERDRKRRRRRPSARLRRVTADLAATLDHPSPAFANLRFGVIAAVDAGAATDGNDQATVTIRGNDVLASHLGSYTPVVGHEVAVLLVDGSPLIIGRRVGMPTF